jgi:hypothetical protein
MEACNQLTNVNVELALLAGLGGAGGYSCLGLHLTNPYRSAFTLAVARRSRATPVANNVFRSFTEGGISGYTELGLSSLRHDTPVNKCPKTCAAP